MSKYSETELILPALHIMSIKGSITTSDLIAELREILKPDGEDAMILKGRRDDRFSQIARNLVSHKTLVRLGYATFANSTFTITKTGLDYITEKNNKEKIDDEYSPFEGSETLDSISIVQNVNDVYPNAALNIERVQYSVFELKRKEENKKLLLDPDFQRKDVWDTKQKSELVESVLMNIPLPFIYLTENKKGELVVVDGRQRLTALFQFIKNKFKLKDLKILTNVSGKKFQDLEPLMQGIIEDYQLVTHVIKPPTSDRVIIDIFDRVNRSGTRLNNQEIRNALYQGSITKLLTTLSNLDIFKSATDNSIKPERMRDKYIITRFLSFYIWRSIFFPANNIEYDYKGDTEDFLAKYMQYINSLDNNKIIELEKVFTRAMENSYKILGTDAFRLPNKKNPLKKRPINMALFESLGYLMSDSKTLANKDLIKKEYEILLSKEEFIKSFLSIDSTTKYRFEVMDKIKSKLR